ncbi:type II secretion system protein [Loigolactobacillus zhaoyuanensis]|uniref:Type II secretion system protein n=1 Tax=Loigolactobacillus zhaoyuanensis TaxID=2486017 RepID=A0ABW8UEN3_9LACO|nr:type II secretion system protein [Loigolactobacillus zhaoyuanensis]
MNKQRAFALVESICALTIVVIGIYTFNTTFQQFILKLRQQRQSTDQAQVLWIAAQRQRQQTKLSQLQINGYVYQVQTQPQKIGVGQGAHYAEISW